MKFPNYDKNWGPFCISVSHAKFWGLVSLPFPVIYTPIIAPKYTKFTKNVCKIGCNIGSYIAYKLSRTVQLHRALSKPTILRMALSPSIHQGLCQWIHRSNCMLGPKPINKTLFQNPGSATARLCTLCRRRLQGE